MDLHHIMMHEAGDFKILLQDLLTGFEITKGKIFTAHYIYFLTALGPIPIKYSNVSPQLTR